MVLRWGICTAGRISSDFTNAIFLAKEDNKPVAVAARSIERAKEFAGTFDIPRFYGSYEELANDPEVDVIYIGAITAQHDKLSILFMNHKKHVLCEKPMSNSLAKVKQMFEVAKANQVFLMEGFWSRCFPVYAEIKKEIEAKTIGNVVKVNASFEISIDITESGLFALGCYPIQFALWAIPKRPISWSIDSAINKVSGADKTGNITLRFEDDQVAYLTYHLGCNGSTSAAIYGDAGSIKIKECFWSPQEMTVNDEVKHFPIPAGSKHPYNYPNSAGFVYEAEHVRRCIEKGDLESDLVSRNDSLLIMEILESFKTSLGLSDG